VNATNTDRKAALFHRPRAANRCAEDCSMKAMGAGIAAVHPFQYLNAMGGGRHCETIVDSGIHVAPLRFRADSTLDPWLMIYYNGHREEFVRCWSMPVSS